MLKKLMAFFRRKETFRRFVARRSAFLRAATRLPDFPKGEDYREIKLFVNVHRLPPEMGALLEELHDEFHLRRV